MSDDFVERLREIHKNKIEIISNELEGIIDRIGTDWTDCNSDDFIYILKNVKNDLEKLKEGVVK
jgi:hypothetical protein